MCVCMYARTYVGMYMCVYVCMYVHISVCMYVIMYVRVFVCIYVCVYDRIVYVNQPTIISKLSTLSSQFTCHISDKRWVKFRQTQQW